VANSKALIGIFSQTAGSTCEFWVNPVDFTLASLGTHAQVFCAAVGAAPIPCPEVPGRLLTASARAGMP
jgi:hypothetical protein